MSRPDPKTDIAHRFFKQFVLFRCKWAVALPALLTWMVCGHILPLQAQTPPATTTPESGTVLVLQPSVTTILVGQTFSVTIQVRTSQMVDGSGAYVNFDPTVLQAAAISPSNSLSLELQNQIDNTQGHINFVAGQLNSPFPSRDFVLATVRFQATRQFFETLLTFESVDPQRQSNVTFNGNSILSNYQNAAVVVVAPPTATQTPTLAPPTATRTPTLAPPTATRTPIPPTATRTPTLAPPTATRTPIRATATRTPTLAPPTATRTPIRATVTPRPIAPTATRTPMRPLLLPISTPNVVDISETALSTDTPIVVSPPITTPLPAPTENGDSRTWPLEGAGDSVFSTESAFGHTVMSVPAAAIAEKQPDVLYALSYVEQATPLPVPDSLFSFVGRAFHLELLVNGQTQPEYRFAEPVSLILEYLPGQDLDPNALALFGYDRSANHWFSEDHWVSSVDPAAQTVHVAVPQTGHYVLGLRVSPSNLPVEPMEAVGQLFLPMISGECTLECQTRPSASAVQLFLPTVSR